MIRVFTRPFASQLRSCARISRMTEKPPTPESRIPITSPVAAAVECPIFLAMADMVRWFLILRTSFIKRVNPLKPFVLPVTSLVWSKRSTLRLPMTNPRNGAHPKRTSLRSDKKRLSNCKY